MSKGSKPRPFSVDQKTFDSNWNKIFKRSIKEQAWDHYSDLPAPNFYEQPIEQKDDEYAMGRST